MRAKHVFLILAVVSATFGFTAGDSPYLEVGRPLSGIFFGLFLITTVLQKESDLYEEQRAQSDFEPVHRRDESDSELAASSGLTPAHSQ